MIVKELIEELQKCSPDAVVSVFLKPVLGVKQKPYYEDGYNAEVKDWKWIYNRTKDKVYIHYWEEGDFVEQFFFKYKPSLEDILKNVENVPVDWYLDSFRKEYEIIKNIYEEINTKKSSTK